MKNIIAFIIVVVFVILLAMLGIWAINTLFAAGISYTANNIVAALVLIILANGSGRSAMKLKTGERDDL